MSSRLASCETTDGGDTWWSDAVPRVIAGHLFPVILNAVGIFKIGTTFRFVCGCGSRDFHLFVTRNTVIHEGAIVLHSKTQFDNGNECEFYRSDFCIAEQRFVLTAKMFPEQLQTDGKIIPKCVIFTVTHFGMDSLGSPIMKSPPIVFLG